MDEKYIYIVMEYCDGKELFALLEEKKILGEKEAANIVFKVIEGLNHLHTSCVAHRDLKPENIMIDSQG